MKKRIVAFVLAVVTVLQLCSMIPIVAEEASVISIEEMEVGVLYKATFKHNDVYLKNATGNRYEEAGLQISIPIKEENLPTNLLVMKEWDGSDLVCIKNEDWPAKFEYYRYVDQEEIIISGKAESEPEIGDNYIYGKVDIFCDEAEGGVVRIEKGQKVYAFARFDESIGENASYMWQIKIGNGKWANITDFRQPYAVLSNALLVNAPTADVATFRCIVTDGNKQYASGEIGLVKKASAGEPKFAQGTAAIAEDEEEFQVRIDYLWANKDNTSVPKPPLTHDLSENESFHATIKIPFIEGYTACVVIDESAYDASKHIKYNNTYYEPISEVEFDIQPGATTGVHVTVWYVPQKTNFIIQHWYQNLNDDGYSLAGTEVIKDLYADEQIGEGRARDEEGFTALYYDHETTVSGNGNTVVEIYYDRVYYLVNFELGDGGYGLMPYYVRYGTTVTLTAPTRPGYSFKDPWALTRVYTKDEETKVETDLTIDATLSSAYANKNANAEIVVKHNLVYTANWNVESVSYTIIYWLEDPDFKGAADSPERYKIWGTKSVTGAKTGDIVDGPLANDVPKDWVEIKGALVKDDGNRTEDINLLNYYVFVKSDQDKEVKGDGSTTVNVYYDRKEYTLKFYYACQRVENNGTPTYYVAGNTNPFADGNSNDEHGCLKNVWSNNAFGEVVSLPTIKDGLADEKGYTLSSDGYEETTTSGSWWNQTTTTTTYTYYYLSFKAKYGANISEQYPCDIFNSVQRTSNRTSGSWWTDKTVLMSAWSGEENVLFSTEGGNQTMKGKFQILDYRMLWNPSVNGWNSDENDNTVSYLAFWENALGNIDWNIPELYRYKIWLEVLDGQELPANTTYYTYQGTRYYLKEWYDTCDNSEVKQQTQPTLVGYKRETYSSRGNIKGDDYRNWNSTEDLSREEANKIREMNQYNEAYVVNYFYKREIPRLIFSNHYDPPVSENLKYETDLNRFATKVPDYPSSMEKGAYVFEGDLDGDGVGDGTGWYIDENCTTAFSFNQTMGTDDIQLFAKWIPTKHRVTVYRQESEIGSTESGKLLLDKTVNFGTQVQESELAAYTKPEDDYVFGGWYYKDGGEEYRYDFNTMAIKHEYVIYAKWIANNPIAYEVWYVTIVDGEEVEIAKREGGVALEGVVKTFTAKTGDALYEGYASGYFPTERYYTLEMDVFAENNIVKFEYVQPATIEYTVQHVFVSADLKTYLGASRTLTGNYKNVPYVASFDGDQTMRVEFTHQINVSSEFTASIQESFDALVGEDFIKTLAGQFGLTNNNRTKVWDIVRKLTPDYIKQELILTADSHDNVMTFNWQKADNTIMVQTITYAQDNFATVQANKTYYIYHSATKVYDSGKRGETFTAEWIGDIYGYVRNEAISKQSGKFTTGSTFENVLVLELYWDRATYHYTAHHYVEGTTTSPAGLKDETLTALYGQTIKVLDIAKKPNGYVLANGDTTHTIGSDGYELIVFYSPLEVTFMYQAGQGGKVVASVDGVNVLQYIGSVGTRPDPETASRTAVANAGYRFVGWFLDSDGTQAVGSLATLSSNGEKITPNTPTADMANETYTFFAVFEPTNRVFVNDGVSDAHQSFIYKLQGTGVDVTFVITGNNSVEFTQIPTGQYTITILHWAWRYENPTIEIGDTTYTVRDDGTCDIEIEGTYDVVFNYAAPSSDQWLTDSAIGAYQPVSSD